MQDIAVPLPELPRRVARRAEEAAQALGMETARFIELAIEKFADEAIAEIDGNSVAEALDTDLIDSRTLVRWSKNPAAPHEPAALGYRPERRRGTRALG